MAGALKRRFKYFLKRTGIRKGLIGGVLILVVVDIIWVGSVALTRYLFTQESYPKPLFTTYFKTSLFSIYLVAFVFWRPWHRLCLRGCTRKRKCGDVRWCKCGEGEVCRCSRGALQDEERDPLLSPTDSDVSDTDNHDNNTKVTESKAANDDEHIEQCEDEPSSKYGSVTNQSPQGSGENQLLLFSGHELLPGDVQSTDLTSNKLLQHFEEAALEDNETTAITMSHDVDRESCLAPDRENNGLTQELEQEREQTLPSSRVEDTLLRTDTTSDGGTIDTRSKVTPSDSTPVETLLVKIDTVSESSSSNCDKKGGGVSMPAHPSLPPANACPFASYLHDEGRESGPKFLTFTPSSGSINGSGGSRIMTCPLNPELKICILGPPEIESLGCYDTDSTDDEREQTEPLSPCHTKCCKVKFKPTVEVREFKEQDKSFTSHKRLHHFKHSNKKYQKEKFVKKKQKELAKVALLALIFGILDLLDYLIPSSFSLLWSYGT